MSRLDPDSQPGNNQHKVRRWLLAVALGIVGGGAAAALVSWLVPVRYEAFALLKVAHRPPAVLGKAADSSDDFAIFKRTQIDLIKSNVVMHGTFRENGINKLSMVREHSDDPIAWLSNELIVHYPNDAEVLRIALKGPNPSETAQIVNQVVATYLKDVVQHEKEIRNAERSQLERLQVAKSRELNMEMDSLHKMEQVQGVSSSEAAQLQKRLVTDQLADVVAERRDTMQDLRRNKLQIMLAQARKENAVDAAAAEAPSAIKDAESTSLPLLETEKEFLESSLEDAEKSVNEKAILLQKMERYSADVASKREHLAQQQRIANQIDERLNLISVESLAQDRITKLDDAAVPRGKGDVIRRRVGAALAAVLGFGLIVIVVAVATRSGKSAEV